MILFKPFFLFLKKVNHFGCSLRQHTIGQLVSLLAVWVVDSIYQLKLHHRQNPAVPVHYGTVRICRILGHILFGFCMVYQALTVFIIFYLDCHVFM